MLPHSQEESGGAGKMEGNSEHFLCGYPESGLKLTSFSLKTSVHFVFPSKKKKKSSNFPQAA